MTSAAYSTTSDACALTDCSDEQSGVLTMAGRYGESARSVADYAQALWGKNTHANVTALWRAARSCVRWGCGCTRQSVVERLRDVVGVLEEEVG